MTRALAASCPALAAVVLVALVTPEVHAQAGDVRVGAALLRADGSPLGLGDRLVLGERAILVLTVEAPVDARVFVPSNPSLSPFRLLERPPPPERRVDGARVTEVHRLPVTPLRVGAKKLPAIEVVYQAADGTSGSVRTERLRIRVDGRLGNEQDPRLGAAPPAVEVIATNWALVWALSILGASVVATLLTLIVLRLLRSRLEAARPPPPPRPANVVALDKLASLGGVTDLESPELMAAIVDVLREYLGGRYGFDGLEHTTREMRLELQGLDLKGITSTEITAMLEDADLVKFARLEPSLDEAQALIPRVRVIVETTWEEPEEVEELAAALPLLEPASAAERVKAGLVDVVLALAIASLTLTGLWAFSALEWGWTAVLAMGLVLWLRDAAGPGSPGKALLGLRVVRRTERQGAPSLGRRLLRNLLLLLPPAGLPVEVLVLIYHPLRHRVGDLMSGTQVVRGGGRA